VTDSVQLTDTVTVAVMRVVTDPAGLTDVAASLTVSARTVTDGAGVADDVTVVHAWAVSVTDLAGLADTGPASTVLTAITDAMPLTDAVSVATVAGVVVTRTVTDLAGLTDGVAAAARVTRNITLTAVSLQPRYTAGGVPPRYPTTALPRRWVSMTVTTTTRRMALGSTEMQGISFTGPPGVDLSGDPVLVAAVEAATQSPVNPIWLTPTLLDAAATRITAWLLIGPQGGLDVALGRWRIWAKLTDSPEVPWIPAADTFTVV
jgi:hypothetical protein